MYSSHMIHTQVVLQGISAAEKKIQATTDEEYHIDNLVRRIPLIGSLYGWIRPKQATAVPVKVCVCSALGVFEGICALDCIMEAF